MALPCYAIEDAKMPDLEQLSRQDKPDLKEYFIVRKASWEPLPALLLPDVIADWRKDE